MTSIICLCGFEGRFAGDFMDHFGDAGTLHDDIALDGKARAEATATDEPTGDQTALRCLCGFSAGTGPELDAQPIAVFTAPGTVGRDGRAHRR